MLELRVHVPDRRMQLATSIHEKQLEARNLRPPSKRHLSPNLGNEVVVNHRSRYRWLVVLCPNVRQHHAPWVDDHAVSIADSLLVMPAYLRSCDDVRLGLYGPGSEQYLPVGLAGWDGERGWKGEDVATLMPQGKADFGKSELYLLVNAAAPEPDRWARRDD